MCSRLRHFIDFTEVTRLESAIKAPKPGMSQVINIAIKGSEILPPVQTTVLVEKISFVLGQKKR